MIGAVSLAVLEIKLAKVDWGILPPLAGIMVNF